MPALQWFSAGTAYDADANPGGEGLSTGLTASLGPLAAESGEVAGMDVAPGLAGTPAGHPVTYWFAIIAVLLGLKYASEAAGSEGEFGNIRVGVLNLAVITFSALIGLVFLKWLTASYRIPGLTELVAAA